ncbi:MAG TPA: ATP-binding protein [Actinomycetota bacterium]|nr:ATP-binding protein [Actinomycetota bacterium]
MTVGVSENPILVIVTGPPGSGKTTVARQISAKAGLPLFTKDDFKVIFYEIFGWGGREPDRRASAAAYEVMYHLAAVELSCGRSLIVEANFREEATERFRELSARHRFHPFQVRCTASREVLTERLRERADGGVRHPGHADDLNFEQLDYLLASGPRLPLEGTFFEIDTTDSEDSDAAVEKVCLRLMNMLDPSEGPETRSPDPDLDAGSHQPGRSVSGPLGGAG